MQAVPGKAQHFHGPGPDSVINSEQPREIWDLVAPQGASLPPAVNLDLIILLIQRNSLEGNSVETEPFVQ